MKNQSYKLDDWAVQIFYSVNSSDFPEIEEALEEIDCPQKLIDKAYEQVKYDDPNIGFTYSNFVLQKSIIVIGEVSSIDELFNTLIHELYHLIDHIRIVKSYDYEETATLLGDFVQIIFKNIIDVFNQI